ncbi:unnamed protein product [Clonostachys rosea f. rosea IK726]|uniref:Uncharacterized protein n=4 Tax=Clonostachys rosea f. rosea IK726 TaxID=1349383 RepID=A0ACA9UEU2_BIOOC|nr:unnamed protein product [Clonostachys rosea f. rosea IK726]CAG9951849.1 unnamed protein product [Clonostachys rosea f. rosea IK726]CAG9951856.1 unnamed protein product [Clonostachys rosea f. rosea IK726]CAG9957259.1 unnamed protein product [Clonostachys rosea f. rosea IK726]
MPTSVGTRECFLAPLPLGIVRPKKGKYNMVISEATLRMMKQAEDPPRLSVLSTKHLIKLAAEFLSRPDTIEKLDGCSVGPWEEKRRHIINEGDVVNASATQLLNPIDTVLGLLPSAFTIRDQLGSSSKRAFADRTWVIQDRIGQENKMRFQPDGTHAYAALDFKAPHSFDSNSFDIFYQTASASSALPTSGPPATSRPAVSTANTTRMLALALHYATQYRTRFIALFDWMTLVLFVFDDYNEPRTMQVSTIEERDEFRPALLGFLMVATE